MLTSKQQRIILCLSGLLPAFILFIYALFLFGIYLSYVSDGEYPFSFVSLLPLCAAAMGLAGMYVSIFKQSYNKIIISALLCVGIVMVLLMSRPIIGDVTQWKSFGLLIWFGYMHVSPVVSAVLLIILMYRKKTSQS